MQLQKFNFLSTIQIYKIVSCRRGGTTIYPALWVFYACIVLKIAHSVDIKISKRHRPLQQKLTSDVGKIKRLSTLKAVSLYVLSEHVQYP